MSYRLNTQVKPLIWIESHVERFSHSRIEYYITAKSQFRTSFTAKDVEIIIKVPSDADSPRFKTPIGFCRYDRANNAIIWKIRTLNGNKEYLMKAHFNLPSVESENDEGKEPIQVKFEIPYYTASGLKVRYLKIVEKSGYPALPWVRYVTKNGDYQIRTK
jgi:AP-1 complex subunit mu